MRHRLICCYLMRFQSLRFVGFLRMPKAHPLVKNKSVKRNVGCILNSGNCWKRIHFCIGVCTKNCFATEFEVKDEIWVKKYLEHLVLPLLSAKEPRDHTLIFTKKHVQKHLARSKWTAICKSFGRRGAGNSKILEKFTSVHILKKMHILKHAALWRTMSEKNVNKCEKISEHDHVVLNFGRTRKRYWFFEKMQIFLSGFVCTLKSAVLKDNERRRLVLKIVVF